MSEIKALQNFLDNSHSSYHAAANLAAMLTEAGYTRLSEKEEWDLVPGGKYFLVRCGTNRHGRECGYGLRLHCFALRPRR